MSVATKSKHSTSKSEPSKPTELAETTFDKFGAIGFRIAVAFLFIQMGILMAIADMPLFRMTRDGLTAAQALMAELSMQAEEYPICLWYPSRQEEKGVIRNDEARISPGFTLYSSGHESAVLVIDDQGNEVHRWGIPFSQVWKSAPHIPRSVPDKAIYIRRFHAYENGDLLALYETPTTTPNGRGLAKLDLQGKPLWTYDDCTHHDLTVGDDGRIYTLTQTIRSDAHPAFGYLPGPQIEEFVSVLSADGEELQKLSLFELFGKSPFFRGIVTRTDHHGDILHSNTVSLIGDGFASHYDAISSGDLMVCLRNLNLAIVINLEEEEIVWATSGPWDFPHDPTPMDDGTILAFDNCFTWGTEVRSRVVQFDPVSRDIVWSFSGADESLPLLSHIRSCQQRLPNGNTLITESDHGRLLEVTTEGEIVWEFVNPVRSDSKTVQTPVVSGGVRLTADELPFLAQPKQLAWGSDHDDIAP
ncbi:MAG: aryl-sulfate sulfotransferase [Planctomycetaceae bacterium]|nr:aryl-sulfate sulfotransferase [Planctomycetaceae bacterium]